MPDEIVILGGVRTAIGTFGGSLAAIPPIALAATAAREALARSGVEGGQIGQVVFGHVINTEPRDMYLSRAAALDAGVPDAAPAMNVNRLCGSGAQAIVSCMQALKMGDADFALAGGAESMSRSPYALTGARWGQKMGDTAAMDMMLGALTCPMGTGHMGVTAENVAADVGITREEQDAFALESQTRAAGAILEGRFASQIVPVEVKVKREIVGFDTDEHPKATTPEALAKLRPAFKKDGTVTAGNASGLNDGAAAVVLATAAAANKAGLKPRARILGYAVAGVPAHIMGVGPITAVGKLLDKLAMTAADFDVIESNEAFAAQAIAVNRGLGLDPAKVNPNGGAIALGHPLGATGAILTVKALHELDRIGGSRALVTMCIGGGQGIALALERSAAWSPPTARAPRARAGPSSASWSTSGEPRQPRPSAAPRPHRGRKQSVRKAYRNAGPSGRRGSGHGRTFDDSQRRRDSVAAGNAGLHHQPDLAGRRAADAGAGRGWLGRRVDRAAADRLRLSPRHLSARCVLGRRGRLQGRADGCGGRRVACRGRGDRGAARDRHGGPRHHPFRRDICGARDGRGAAEGRRQFRAARHQAHLEQPQRQALHAGRRDGRGTAIAIGAASGRHRGRRGRNRPACRRRASAAG